MKYIAQATFFYVNVREFRERIVRYLNHLEKTKPPV
jgi:hypothetical protein